MKHIKKVKPQPAQDSNETSKAPQKPEGARRPIQHIRPCIPVDGG